MMPASASCDRVSAVVQSIVDVPREWLHQVAPQQLKWLRDAAESDSALRLLADQYRQGLFNDPQVVHPDHAFVLGAVLFAAAEGRDTEAGMAALECPVHDLRLLPVRVEVARKLLGAASVEGAPGDKAFVLTQLGNALAQLPFGSRIQNQLDALWCFERAAELAQDLDDHSLHAAVLNNMANVSKERPGPDWMAHHTRAIELYQKSLSCLEAALEGGQVSAGEYESRFANVTANLANALRDRAPHDAADSSVRHALALFRRVLVVRRQPALDRAETLRNMAIALTRCVSGGEGPELREALECLEEARGIYDAAGAEFWSAIVSLNVGSALMRGVEATLKGESANRCSDSRELPGRPEVDRARRELAHAESVLERLGHRRERIAALRNLGVLEYQAGEPDQARVWFTQAARLVERERSDSTSMLARRDWLIQFVDILEGAAVAAAVTEESCSSEERTAIEWLDRCAGRTLNEWLEQRHMDDTDLRRREIQSLSRECLWGSDDQSAEHDVVSPDGSSAACTMADLQQMAGDLDATLLHLRATPWGTCAAAVFPNGAVDALLLEDFSFFELDDLLAGLLMSTGDGSQRLAIQVDRTGVPSESQAASPSVRSLESVLAELGARVWKKLDHWLRSHLDGLPCQCDVAALVICAGPGLNALPLQAIPHPDGTGRVQDRYDITYTPSLSVLWKRLRERDTEPAVSRAHLLVVADPLGDLPCAAWEARTVADLFSGRVHAARRQSGTSDSVTTADDVRELYPDSEIALFATHAEFHSRDPFGRSRLILAAGEPTASGSHGRRGVALVSHAAPTDGNSGGVTPVEQTERRSPDCLTLRELFQLDLRRNWLTVFSACDSALSDTRDPTCEAIGFPGAILVAGGTTAIGSLWKVDDTATALISTRFFQELVASSASADTVRRKSRALGRALRWVRQLTRPEAERIIGQSLESHLTGEYPFEAPELWAAFACYGVP